MAIRYAVDLTDAERAALREIISQNKAKRSTIINAYILLKADRTSGWTNADIAAAYEVSTKKVEQLKKRFVEEGFENVTMRKIADFIEYSPTTVYLYFKDKREIFYQLH